MKKICRNFLLWIPSFEDGVFEGIHIYRFLRKDTSNNGVFIERSGCRDLRLIRALKALVRFNQSINCSVVLHDWQEKEGEKEKGKQGFHRGELYRKSSVDLAGFE